jgi:hypothetical protein
MEKAQNNTQKTTLIVGIAYIKTVNLSAKIDLPDVGKDCFEQQK